MRTSVQPRQLNRSQVPGISRGQRRGQETFTATARRVVQNRICPQQQRAQLLAAKPKWNFAKLSVSCLTSRRSCEAPKTCGVSYRRLTVRKSAWYARLPNTIAPGRFGEQLRRVEEPVGMGRVQHAGPEAVPGNGAHHRAGLQLVDDFHAAGNSRQMCGGHHLSPLGAARYRTANRHRNQTTVEVTTHRVSSSMIRSKNRFGQYAFQGTVDCQGVDER